MTSAAAPLKSTGNLIRYFFECNGVFFIFAALQLSAAGTHAHRVRAESKTPKAATPWAQMLMNMPPTLGAHDLQQHTQSQVLGLELL